MIDNRKKRIINESMILRRNELCEKISDYVHIACIIIMMMIVIMITIIITIIIIVIKFYLCRRFDSNKLDIIIKTA